MNKLKMGAAIVLALYSVAVSGFLYRAIALNARQSAEIDGYKGTLDALAKDREHSAKVLGHRAKKNAATGRKQAGKRSSLAAAAASNPEWADQPVPKEVQDALSD